MSNYKPIYVDLKSGSKFYLDSPINASVVIFKFFQTVASATWAIPHEKNTNKFILVVNDGEQFGVNEIVVVDNNNLSVEFSQPATGEVTLIIFE